MTGCDDCRDRREFLRELAAITAAGALGLSPTRPATRSVNFVTGRTSGDDVTYPIPTQDGVTIDKEHEVMLARHQQAVYAFGLSCPHQKTPLRWQEADHRFQCPKHKSTFDPDGAFITGRATRSLDRYSIRRDADNVSVDLGKLYREDESRESWIAAVVRL